MEINFSKLSFAKSHNVLTIIIAVLGPSMLFWLIYDYDKFIELESLKIILLCIGIGGFLYVINIAIYSSFVLIIDSITGLDSFKNKNEDDLDIGSILAIIAYSFSNTITIGNLIRLKYYINQPQKYWLKNSIDTWLLAEGIMVSFCIFLLIAARIVKKKK